MTSRGLLLLVLCTACGNVSTDHGSGEPEKKTKTKPSAIEACPASTVEWPMARRCAGRGSWTASVGTTAPKAAWTSGDGRVTDIVIGPNGNPVAILDDRLVNAFDRVTGEVLWSLDSQPVALAVGPSGTVYLTTGRDLTAIAEDGSVLWTVPVVDDQTGWTLRFALLEDESSIVTTVSYLAGVGMKRLDPTGKELWAKSIATHETHDLAVKGDSIYLSSGSGFHALDIATGAQTLNAVLHEETPGILVSPFLSVSGSRVLVASELGSFSVERSGSVDWAHQDGLPNPRSFATDPRGYAFGTVTAGDASFDHVAIRPDGSIAWRVPAQLHDSAFESDPAPIVDAAGNVYFFFDGALTIVADTGEVLYEEPLDANTAAMSDDGTLYVGGEDGLTALR